jgi:hypothetical protein
MKTMFRLFILVSIISIGIIFYLNAQTPEPAVFETRDKEIVDGLLKKFGHETNASTSELVVKIGTELLGTPYVENTLEKEPEQLVVNLRELDCTTFAENCLAIAGTIKTGKPNFNHYLKTLQNIRYRNGIIDGYPSRIHYFSDWIWENNKRNVIQDVSSEIAGTRYIKTINFMSSHPESYRQLKNAAFIPPLIKQEKEISKREMFYLPEEKLAEYENQLKEGDIAGITTNIPGLDILHVVILIRKNDKIHLLHASQTAGKVIISEETLIDYLKNSKSGNGIMVARPQ